jgi:hypothetical protein
VRFGTPAAVSAGLFLLFYFIALQGHATRLQRIGLGLPFALAIGLLPAGLERVVPHLPFYASDMAVLITCAFAGAFVFGVYLTVLMLVGIEHQQAFTVLGHPGYKHFVRLCVHPDGKVEAWAIGKDDMLDDNPPLMIDRFEWDPKDH